MPAPDKSAATDKTADKPDTGEATTSTSATDASTTEGKAAAGRDSVSTSTTQPPGQTPTSAPAEQGQPASTNPPADGVTRVVVEQPAPEPAVFYGDGGLQAPTATAPVKAKYEPFEW